MDVFATLPVELLETIAYYAGTHDMKGPPKELVPLLTVNRATHTVISFENNPHLYARIYAHKFDTKLAVTRYQLEKTSAVAFAVELKRRFVDLTCLRGRFDCLTEDGAEDRGVVTLWTAYLMMLENEGKNEKQLREYAGLGDYLRDYWFHPRGASLASLKINSGGWPEDNERNALAMWLFWMLLKPEQYDPECVIHHNYRNVIRSMALGAHAYTISNAEWHQFRAPTNPRRITQVNAYDQIHSLSVPPLVVPAILAFFVLEARGPRSSSAGLSGHTIPLTPSSGLGKPALGLEWAREWERCSNLGLSTLPATLSGAYRPGSIEGVWEGTFTYTEFNAFAYLLSGAGPSSLQENQFAHHRQTWKLREHYLYAGDGVDPLLPGHSMVAYFPVGASLQKEESGGISVEEPGRGAPVRYTRRDEQKAEGEEREIIDVVVTGEGHSAWGEFMIMGRVRPRDGFIMMHKTYTSGQRGTWIYRGYIVGDVNANFAGRWRDTMTAEEEQGYEGPFAMSRRR